MILGALLSAALPSVSDAAIFNVDSTVDTVDAAPGDGICRDLSGQCTLRAAVMETNALPGADLINLPSGAFNLTILGSEDVGASGDLDITDDVGLKGTGSASTVIDGAGLDRVFEIRPGHIVGIQDVTIVGGATPDRGGGITNRTGSTLVLSRVALRDNTAGNGGGIDNAGLLNLIDVTIDGNTATAGGGGIYNEATASLAGVTISGNGAATGAGIYNAGFVGTTLFLTNVTISDNQATVQGGGIFTEGGVDLTNVTLSRNRAPAGQGGGIARSGSGAAQFKNTIVSGNTGDNCSFAPIPLGNNIDDDGSCGFTLADPMIGPLQDNGGPTATHALPFGSPAIDAGNNVGCPSADQRGVTRPRDGNGDAAAICDIGAYEFFPVVSLPADLQITKDDGVTTYTAGGTLIYEIVATNGGPNPVIGAVVTDPITTLPQVESASWVCMPAGGASCTAGPVAGDIIDKVDLPFNATATYTLTVNLRASATGDLINVAEIAAPFWLTDPDSGNNQAIDTDTPASLTSISGTVYEDVDGDAALGDAVGAANVRVRLYADLDDDGTVSAGDSFIGQTTTGPGNGDYSFQVDTSSDGTKHLVVVDSKGVTPSSGFNGGFDQSEAWAEQTYGDDPTTSALDPGPRLGGRIPGACDSVNPGSTAVAANEYQHVGRVDVGAGDVGGVDFAFSFKVVTHQSDGPDCDLANPRTRQGSLRQAVQNTNAMDGGDIVQVPAGTYPLSLSGTGENGALTGDLDVRDSLALAGAGVADTIIDGLTLDRVLELHNAATTLISNLTIRNGDSGNQDGGGIRNLGSLSLTNAVVTGNSSLKRGGGIYADGGSASLALSGVVVSGNSAEDGGGIWAKQLGAAPTLTDVTLSGNTATKAGGGIYSEQGDLAVANVTISGNGAQRGAGIYNKGNSFTQNLINVTLSGNTATVGGGGIWSQDGSVSLSNVTLSGNTAPDGGGIFVDSGSPTLKNTIVANSASGGNCSGSVTSGGNNLDSANTCAFSGPGDRINEAPLLGPLQDNGGATFTHALSAASPAVDAAHDTGCPPVDQRGVARPFDGDGNGTPTCDIGAYEFDGAPLPRADLRVTKDDGVTSYIPGGSVTYTIVVDNAGPDPVIGASVTDAVTALPQVSSAAWTCVPAGGASCTAGPVAGDLADSVGLPNGGSATYTLIVNLDAGATGDLVNTATVALPGGVIDPDGTNNSASDTDTQASVADLSLSKSVDNPTPDVGDTVVFTLTVQNDGPDGATGVVAVDALPDGYSYLADNGGGSYVAATGAWSVGAVGASSQVELQIMATVNPSGEYGNTAEISASDVFDPDSTPNNGVGQGEDDEASAATTPTPVADLGITKDDGAGAVIPGNTVIYTIVISNDGPSNVSGATVSDVFDPAKFDLGGILWNCAITTGTGSCGASSGSGDINATVDLEPGGEATFTVTAPTLATASGVLDNTATVTSGDATDPDLSNNSDSDTDVLGAPVADLGVTKDDGVATYTPGGSVTYTIVVTNAGPSDVGGVTVSDAITALPQVASASWSCVGAGGASCTAGPIAGDIDDSADVPVGGAATYTLVTALDPDATGDLVNTASVAPPGGVSDPNAANDSAVDTDTEGAPIADLGITKDDGVASYTPGGSVSYTIVVTNAGPSDVTGATVTDAVTALPQVSSASWTCLGAGGASCAAGPVAGDISDSVDLPVGGTATYTLVAALDAGASGDLTNVAAVTPPGGTTDPNGANDGALDTDTQGAAVADLGVAMSDGVTSYTPGGSVTYSITVTNAGPSAVSGATLIDAVTGLPQVAGASWTCVAGGGASCTAGPVAGDINDTVDLPPGGTATYTLLADVDVAATGDLVNTASVAPPAGVTDPVAADNTVADTNGQGSPIADLTISKDDGQATYTPGGTVVYTIVASNAGPSDAYGARVTDAVTALPQVQSASWSCVAGAGAACGAASGTGDIDELVDLPVGTSATFSLTVTLDPLATGDLVNSVNIAPPAGTADDKSANDVATDNDLIRLADDTILLSMTASRRDVVTGDNVGYTVTAKNTTTDTLIAVELQNRVPPGFKLVEESARLVRPAGSATSGASSGVKGLLAAKANRPIVFGPFDLGPEEEVQIHYRLRVGSGVVLGEHANKATPFRVGEPVGNTASATVAVVEDPTFDQSIIIGKVFEDRDGDDRVDKGEPGVPNALVVLDDGTQVLTDRYGRFHFPAVKSGHRMLKIDRRSLPPGSEATAGESRIVRITPGLTARANIGVSIPRYEQSIGRPEEPGLAIAGSVADHPIAVRGRARELSVLVNDKVVPLPSGDIRMSFETLEQSVRLEGGELERPIEFLLAVDRPDEVEAWKVEVLEGSGDVLRRFDGRGTPPGSFSWDGRSEDGSLIRAGGVYQYQFDAHYVDGSRSASSRRLFGVDRKTVVSLELFGDAFEVGQDKLSSRAREILGQAAETLLAFPGENVVIEGHTDSLGSTEYNLALSRRRAEAAAAFLSNDLGFPTERILLRWYGEERPVASNALAEGREVNRRVALRAEAQDVESTRIADQFRTEPRARINDTDVEIDADGRFSTRVDGDRAQPLEIELEDPQGRLARTAVAVPGLEIRSPVGGFMIGHGEQRNGCAVVDPARRIDCRIEGRTEPGNTVRLDGRELTSEADGSFASIVSLEPGTNTVGLLVRNEAGYSRSANLAIEVSDTDAEGRLLVVRQAIPNLTVNLPPAGTRLATGSLALAGTTDPGNRVLANGAALEVAADGSFTAVVELKPGTNPFVVRVEDPQGRSGEIASELEVAKNQLFLLAFADGELGHRDGSGFIEGAGVDEDGEFYTDGRLAYYLKGTIAGKYLITSAFDSGREEVADLFSDLNDKDSSRLLRNIDPDKFYPVYGDGSERVYDVESEGKLYLALDSDEIHALVGNYPLALTDTELATYRRTLYGGRFVYESASRTPYGDPDTRVVLFAADVRHAHVRDELRATGGSLYYLSHRDILEGSEEITLVVRDKNTGVVLRRDRQTQNSDYTIKYAEGRVMFHRPISSVVGDDSLVDLEILSGHHVFIEADYETRLDDFDKTASGARVRRQLGDHVALGGTYIEDELELGSYEIGALDATVRLNENTRITAEYADSSGNDSLTFVSNDGGLSFTEAPTSGTEEGSAWKASAELDVGGWFGKPDRYQVKMYYKDLDAGFFSSGSFQEQGTEKAGIDARLAITGADSVQLRHAREDRSGGSLLGGVETESVLTSASWHHRRERWRLGVEYFADELENGDGQSLKDRQFGAARFWSQITEKLSGRVEHQQTLSGEDNDQTSVGLDYQVLPSLSLEVKGTDGELGSSAQAGAVLTLGESEIYLTERSSEDVAGDRTATVLGARSPIGESSRIYTEYQHEDGGAGERAISLVGLQKQWEVSPGYRILLSGESADTDGDSVDNSRSAVAASLSYSNGEGLSAVTSHEYRKESGSADRDQFLTFNKVDYRLNHEFTLLGKYRYSKTDNRGVDEARLEERSLGIAYRPIDNDRFNSLARYTRLFELRPLAAGESEGSETSMDVLSFETVFELSARVEWLGKGAYRRQKERFGEIPTIESRSYLAIQRLNFSLWRSLDLGVELRSLRQRESRDRRSGALSELSWEVMKRFRLGVGYNFTDFSDNELSRNEYSVHGWFLRVQGRH